MRLWSREFTIESRWAILIMNIIRKLKEAMRRGLAEFDMWSSKAFF